MSIYTWQQLFPLQIHLHKQSVCMYESVTLLMRVAAAAAGDSEDDDEEMQPAWPGGRGGRASSGSRGRGGRRGGRPPKYTGVGAAPGRGPPAGMYGAAAAAAGFGGPGSVLNPAVQQQQQLGGVYGMRQQWPGTG
jgi:hypothetical protein